MKWTETSVIGLRAPDDKPDCVIWDEEVTGFGIRFQNGSEKGSYVLHFRIGAKQRKMTIAKVGKITLKAARLQAQEYLLQVSKKTDPALELKKASIKASTSIQPLIQPFLDYLGNDKKRSPGYVKENKRSLDRYFKALHQFAPDDIDRATVARELTTIKKEHGPIAMNRSRSHLSKFFMWMLGEGYAHGNPVFGTNKNEEGARERVLTEKELIAIWNAADSDNHFDKVVRLLMLTAARRDQIGSLRRSEINTEEKQIELAGVQGRTKNKIRFVLPLSKLALDVLNSVAERKESDFVFGEGKGGFSGWSKSKERFDEKCPVKDWVFHDLRRTFDTLAQDKLKIAPHITDLLLSHKGEVKKGVRKHYNFAEYLDEKRDAMTKWGDYITGLVRKPGLKIAA